LKPIMIYEYDSNDLGTYSRNGRKTKADRS